MQYHNFQKQLKKFKKPVCTCMHVDRSGVRCTNKPISSHSLQKSVALKGIATGGHVYALQPSFSPDTARLQFEKVGYSKASTFPGFCKKHDGELFGEIELNYRGLTDRALTLLSYRSLSREYFTKLAQIRLFNSEDVRKRMIQNRGREFYDEFMVGCHLAKSELENLKSRFEEMLHKNQYCDLLKKAYVFDDALPFSFAASFSPHHSLSDEHILPAFGDEWGVVFAFSGRVGSDNVFALTSLRGQAEEQICKFFRSIDLKSLEPRRFALNLGLEYLENLFFSIPWIDALPDQLKKQMTQKMTAGLPGSEQHFPGSFFELDFEF